MKVFEFIAGQVAVNDGSGWKVENRVVYYIPDQAVDLLEPIMEPYDESPHWYFDKRNRGRPPAPWAFVCFPRELHIAGHIDHVRPSPGSIAISTYAPVGVPPENFYPGVGCLSIYSLEALESTVFLSPILGQVWDALKNQTEKQNWLLIFEEIDEEMLAELELDDDVLWRERKQ